MQNRPVASLAECVKDQKLTVAELQVTCLEAAAQMAMEDT
jgi:hypothetical protein